VKLVVQELTIAAPPHVVYGLLTDPAQFVRWMVHRGLGDRAGNAHHGGWRHYLDRLRRLATGEPPGPDPFAGIRVPTPAELGAR
jgi:hypothetical protein